MNTWAEVKVSGPQRPIRRQVHPRGRLRRALVVELDPAAGTLRLREAGRRISYALDLVTLYQRAAWAEAEKERRKG